MTTPLLPVILKPEPPSGATSIPTLSIDGVDETRDIFFQLFMSFALLIPLVKRIYKADSDVTYAIIP